MAGNTKLLGFNPGGHITLQRWGEKVNVDVSQDSLDAIREACTNKLPIKPKVGTGALPFVTTYDETTGRITAHLSPDVASKIAEVMEGKEDDGLMQGWAKDLRCCIQDHFDYLSTEGEPGVEDTH